MTPGRDTQRTQRVSRAALEAVEPGASEQSGLPFGPRFELCAPSLPLVPH